MVQKTKNVTDFKKNDVLSNNLKLLGKNIFTASAIAFLMLASNNRVK